MRKVTLSRDSILRGEMRQIAEQSPGLVRLMTDDQRNDWLDEVINALPQRCPEDSELWLFGYGSLIWNPAFHYAEKRCGRVHGFHRCFCLWTQLGRGCPDLPGLMLGLDRGGSVTGCAYRIAEDVLRTELDIVFRRELMSHAYLPTWVKIRFEDGTQRNCLTFVMDRGHERYAGKVDLETQVKHIAQASGPLGDNCEYLFDLVEHLEELGFRDNALISLADQVRARQAQLCND